MADSQVFQINHLGKTFGSHVVLRDIDFTVNTGDVTCIIGASGSGKSTLLRCINLLETPTSGEILFHNSPITGKDFNQSAYRSKVGMVFQSFNLFNNMTVLENCMVGVIKVLKKSKEEARETALFYLEKVGMAPYINAKPRQLSGGQKQRVAMGRAIVRNPKVFLMDEPLSNLDAKLRGQMRVEIASLHHRLESTFIYVTHDQTEAMTLGTRIVVMKDGVVQQVDTPQNLFRYPANQFVAGFIGTPPMNFMDGVFEYKNQQLAVRTNDGIAIPLTEEKVKHALERADVAGKAVVAGIRPEHLRLLKDGEEEVSFISGEVDVYEMLGSEAIVYVKQPGNENRIIAKVDADTHLKPGDKIRLAFDLEKLHVFDKLTGQTITN